MNNLEKEKKLKKDFDKNPGDFDLDLFAEMLEAGDEETTIEEMRSIAKFWKENYLRLVDDNFFKREREIVEKEVEDYIREVQEI